MPSRPKKKQVKAAIQALNLVRRDWLRRNGATAVDVGFKIKNGEMTDEVALRLHVERKLPIESIPAHEAVTTEAGGDEIDGFPIDVIEARYAPADRTATVAAGIISAEAVDRRQRVDPLVGGVSCGNPNAGGAGTIGTIVYDLESSRPCILSNWHVLAARETAIAGEAIVQPGTLDGGREPADTVGSLTRFRIDRDMDAAIARTNQARDASRDILELNPVVGIVQPALGMRVSKSGRTTGLTEGIIDGIDLSTGFTYSDGVFRSFRGQIHIVPRPPWPAVDVEISEGGDSGSIWIDDASGRAVGLHFAGDGSGTPAAAENALANPIGPVAEALRFSFTPLFQRPVVDLRAQIRAAVCRRFPSICGPQSSVGGGADSIIGPMPQSAPIDAALACVCGRAAQRMSLQGHSDVDALVEEIVELIGVHPSQSGSAET